MICRKIIRYALLHQLDKIIYEYVDRKNEIITQIDSIENEIFYDILFSRYIEQKTFERIEEFFLKEFEKKYGIKYLEE